MNYFHHQQVTEDLSQFQICPALDSKVEQSHCEIQCLTLYSSIQFSTSTTKVSLLHPRGYLTAFLLDKSRKTFCSNPEQSIFLSSLSLHRNKLFSNCAETSFKPFQTVPSTSMARFLLWLDCYCTQTGRTQWRSLYQITPQASGPLDLPTKAFFANFCMQIGNKRCRVLLLENLHIQTRLHHTGQNQTGHVRKDDLG